MPIVCIFMGYLLVIFCRLSLLCQKDWQKSPLSLVPGGAARRSPNRATGGVAGHETTSFPGGESPSRGGGGPSHYYFFKFAVWRRVELPQRVLEVYPTTRELSG